MAARQAVERLPGAELTARQAFAHPLDGPDLEACRAAHILLEEIDDGRAPEGKVARLHGPFEFRHRAVQVDVDVHAVAGRDERLGIESAEIDEQEFLACREIFAEQAKAGERAGRPREKRLLGRKTNRLQRVRRQDHRACVGLVVGQGDRDGMGQQ